MSTGYISLVGIWENEFGSQMQIRLVNESTGFFTGIYKSHTGATGVYNLIGITDTKPDPNFNSQTVAFSVSWRDTKGLTPVGANWVSAFSGQLQLEKNKPQKIVCSYLLQKNTNPSDNWESTIISTATFVRISFQADGIDDSNFDVLENAPNLIEQDSNQLSDLKSGGVAFDLHLGNFSDNGATPWYGYVGLGNPAQMLKFMLDTGTDNTWITSNQCDTQACAAHNRFNAAASSGFSYIDKSPTTKSFGPWGSMIVEIGNDNFSMLGASINKQISESFAGQSMNFELAVSYDGSQFELLDADGGIAIPSPFWKPSKQTQALMIELYKAGTIKNLCASFYTDQLSKQGQCVLGAVDFSKFKIQTLQWLPLIPIKITGLEYLWAIDAGKFLVDNLVINAGITCLVLDTGSSYFKGPSNLIQTLLNAITNNGELPVDIYSDTQMSEYPSISLLISNRIYTLLPRQYFIKLGQNHWQIGIQVLDGMPEGMLLAGSVFLDTLYSIFDFQNSRIGLATKQ